MFIVTQGIGGSVVECSPATRAARANNFISFHINYKLNKSLVTSTLHFGCETWTLHTNTERRIHTFEHCARLWSPSSTSLEKREEKCQRCDTHKAHKEPD
ncbi:hypothetical protein DPMN_156550 [Dreissena polymorpha]|uniref:Uncharacterized protein n=1 Tax=Dreissena polymorpha TaxID=45954 RepID=A0A9D4FTS0_DREPO|nr:hypothetical protein DPMN_156550 [Dreissena polymorpha]